MPPEILPPDDAPPETVEKISGARPNSDYHACDRCGGKYDMDLFLPDHLWVAIAGRTDGGGFYCPWCIDDIAYRKRIRYGGILYFTGRAGSAISDDPEMLRELKRLLVENIRLKEQLKEAKLEEHILVTAV